MLHEEEKNELGLALIFIKWLGACGDDGVWRIWLQEAWSQASRAEHHSLNQAESANARKEKNAAVKKTSNHAIIAMPRSLGSTDANGLAPSAAEEQQKEATSKSRRVLIMIGVSE